MRRATLAVTLASALLSVTAAPALAQDDGEGARPSPAASPTPVASRSPSPSEPPSDGLPYAVCVDGVCRVTDEPREEALAESGASLLEGDDIGGRIVCVEGAGECTMTDPSIPLGDQVPAKGRVVVGGVDADPSGTWRAINLPTRVRCTVGGEASAVRVKRTRSRATIERGADGRLIAQSSRGGEAPFEWVRLGPGVYGSTQPFSDGNVRGVIVTYYGMLDDDSIEATATVTSTLRDGGARTDCFMKRNIDMKRLSSPPGAEGSPSVAE